MTIYFTETEPAEQEYFSAEFAEHEIRFVPTLAGVAEDAEVLCIFIESHIDRAKLARWPHLQMIVTRSRTWDHIDLEACQAAGVQVTNVPSYGDTTVAEHTFALLLALSRRLREAMAYAQKAQHFTYEGARMIDLEGKTIGIYGMGRIARRVVELAQAFRMKVIAHDPLVMSDGLAEDLGFEWVTFDELLARSHVISLHVRLSAKTERVINRETLAKTRPGVLIINTARGGLVDTEALRDALESGHVGGAGLDVLEEERVMRESATKIIGAEIIENLKADATPLPGTRVRDLQKVVRTESLLARDNIVFTPHLAFNSIEAMQRLMVSTAENIRAFLDGEPHNLLTRTR